MIHTYILLLAVTSVISSILTVILMRKDQIHQWWLSRKNKRLKAQVEQIVLDYLNELKNGERNDQHSTEQKEN